MTSDATSERAWSRAVLALSLLAVDPIGLKGVWVRARSGPARDRWIEMASAITLPHQKLHPAISDTQLYGGLDLGATLSAGRLVESDGVLAGSSCLTLTMAERCGSGLAARLGTALDFNKHCLIALDEGVEEVETLPSALTERLGLFVSLDDVALRDLNESIPDNDHLARARALLPEIQMSEDDTSQIVCLAMRLGISSLRASQLAIKAAKAHAAFLGRNSVLSDDIRVAGELVFAHKATLLPSLDQEDAPAPEPEAETPDSSEESGDLDMANLPDEMVLEAVLSSLPKNLLEQLAAGRSLKAARSAGGTGSAKKGNRRGRPLPSKPGRLDGTTKIDLVATLRAAAPWQKIRRESAVSDQALQIRPSDIRVKQYEEKSDRVLVFAVDASGSAAIARLAEAKGAVELLLGEAYARRDHVALIAFRGTGADVLLPPTRSLVQTKRRLASLAGGGGTPLAAGLKSALDLSLAAQSKGMTPTVALLTDGRANIALDGTANRDIAGKDAEQMARVLRAHHIPALVIDTSIRAQPALGALAATLDAPYIPMPRADAHRLSGAVSDAMDS